MSYLFNYIQTVLKIVFEVKNAQRDYFTKNMGTLMVLEKLDHTWNETSHKRV